MTTLRMPSIRIVSLCTLLLALATTSFAANLTGSVTDRTSEKPSSGDEVVLLKLSEGMQEAARGKTDSLGKFTLPIPDDGGQHLVRVTHQGVNYFKPAPSGTTSVQVDVYDAGKQVQGVTGRADIMRIQTENGQMEITELFVLQNNSKPPRTQMSERSFELTLPEGAVVDSSLAAGPGGMPVNSVPVPTGEKNHYAYVFPIRPGETKFQIAYHAPYSGSFSFQPQDRKSTRLNSSHANISYAVFCLKKKKLAHHQCTRVRQQGHGDCYSASSARSIFASPCNTPHAIAGLSCTSGQNSTYESL